MFACYNDCLDISFVSFGLLSVNLAFAIFTAVLSNLLNKFLWHFLLKYFVCFLCDLQHETDEAAAVADRCDNTDNIVTESDRYVGIPLVLLLKLTSKFCNHCQHLFGFYSTWLQCSTSVDHSFSTVLLVIDFLFKITDKFSWTLCCIVVCRLNTEEASSVVC